MAHPLQNSWVLWEHKQVQKPEDWATSMTEVCTFSTVEEFWKYWSFIPRPSEVLFDGTSRKEVDGRTIDAFSVFKRGIKPEWEDPANRAGSELTCRKGMPVELLDAYWENLVLGLIGETIDENDEICGCRVVDKSPKKPSANRTMFRLELWLRNGNAEVADRIKSRMIEALGDDVKGGKAKVPDFDFKRRTPN